MNLALVSLEFLPNWGSACIYNVRLVQHDAMKFGR
jgi:hypothetical protein